GPGEGADPGADVDRHAADVVADRFDLAAVDPGADLDPAAAQLALDRGRAADRPRRAVEGGEEAVPHRLHLAAAVDGELPADGGVVALEQVAPAQVAEPGGGLGRADDVGEEDRRQRALDAVGAATADEEFLDLVQQLGLVADREEVVGAL